MIMYTWYTAILGEPRIWTLRVDGRSPRCAVCFMPDVPDTRRCACCGLEAHRVTCVFIGSGERYACINCRETD